MALIYEEKVPLSIRAAFVAKVNQVATNLNINPNWLMVDIDHETGGRFDPGLWNPKRSYVGLVQFGKLAAKDMGTTLDALSRMSAVRQLDYVEKYYKTWYRYIGIKKADSLVDFYLITLFPKSVNKGLHSVVGNKSFARANGNFAKNSAGLVTVAAVQDALLSKVPSQWKNALV